MGELGVKYKPSSTKQAKLVWRRLLEQCEKMPWELTRVDIEGHTRWMLAQGYSSATASNAVGWLSKFFRWCGDQGVGPESAPPGGAEFNPAAGARRPQVRRFGEVKLLSRKEVEALLQCMRRVPAEVGKRDYAFMVMRLRMGAPLRWIQSVKWGQIERDKVGIWVTWRAAGRTPLPEEAWEAMREALEAGGRLAGMRAEEYVFAPPRYPGRAEAGAARAARAIGQQPGAGTTG